MIVQSLMRVWGGGLLCWFCWRVLTVFSVAAFLPSFICMGLGLLELACDSWHYSHFHHGLPLTSLSRPEFFGTEILPAVFGVRAVWNSKLYAVLNM